MKLLKSLFGLLLVASVNAPAAQAAQQVDYGYTMYQSPTGVKIAVKHVDTTLNFVVAKGSDQCSIVGTAHYMNDARSPLGYIYDGGTCKMLISLPAREGDTLNVHALNCNIGCMSSEDISGEYR